MTTSTAAANAPATAPAPGPTGAVIAAVLVMPTPAGRTWFTELAGAAALEPRRSRPLLRPCLDWTERRPHLGGALGAALCHEFVERGWVVRASGHRAVTITAAWSRALADLLDISVPVSQHIRVVS
jgi:hypothetical protein